MTKYPLCKKLGILRQRATGEWIISTAALWHAIKEDRYQSCREAFVYGGYSGFPDPESVEAWLRKEKRK